MVFTQEEYQRRVNKVKAEISRLGLCGLVVLDDEHFLAGGNIRYLTNYYNPLPPPRAAAAVFTPAGVTLCMHPGIRNSSFSLASQVSWIKNVVGTKVGTWGFSLAQDIKAVLAQAGLSHGRLGVEGLNLLTEPLARSIRSELSGFELVEQAGIVEKLRLVKSQEEMKAIREAAKLNDLGINTFKDAIEADTRVDLAINEAEYMVKKHGAEWGVKFFMGTGTPFVWGTRHGAQKFKAGDLVAAELTAAYEGYYGQVCRSYVVGGKATLEQERAYNAAIEAYREGVLLLKPGVVISDIYAHMNKTVRKTGCEPVPMRFGHGLGISIAEGFEVSENDNTVMQPGFYLAIHPLIICNGGVAIAGNSLLVTETGCEELNKVDF